MRRIRLIALAAIVIANWPSAAQESGLEQIAAIQEMTQRARKALDFAAARLEAAAKAYGADEVEPGRKALDEVGAAVELAVQSLEATGKDPRRNPRHFKNAEIRTRRLLRQIRQLRQSAHIADHPDIDRLIGRVEEGNSKLLLGIMSPKG